MPDNLSQPIPPVPSAPTPMLPASPPPITPLLPTPPPVTPQTAPPTTGRSKKIKIGLAILILFLISVSIPAAVWLTSQRQEVRKEAQGEICCRVMAKNLCGAANGWDQVFTGATRAECNAYNQTFSYSCNCDEYCSTTSGGGCDPNKPPDYDCSNHDGNQICSAEASKGKVCNEKCGKSRCSTSSSDFRVEDVNPAACAGPTATPQVSPTTTPASQPAVCNSLGVSPWPTFTLGQTVLFSCNAASGTGQNVIVGYAFNINGIRHPLASDTPDYYTSNIFNWAPTAGGNVWCGAKTMAGDWVGGQNTSCMTTISLNVISPTPTTTPIPSGTPQPTATPTQPGYTVSCLTCKAYDTNWNQITPANIQLGQTVYFVTRGSTNHPSSIDRARFRININGSTGAWQETPNQHVIGGNYFYYIQYTVASSGSYAVESMVHNSVLDWF